MIAMLKKISLSEHNIAYNGLPIVIGGAVFLGRIVVVLNHTRLRSIFDSSPLYINILIRSLIFTSIAYPFYNLKQIVVEYIFHAGKISVFEAIQHHFASLAPLHIFATILYIFLALLVFNCLSEINIFLAKGKLAAFFLTSKKELEKKPDTEPAEVTDRL